MKTIDKAVLAGYNAGIERSRLRTGIGLIEFERTKEILLCCPSLSGRWRTAITSILKKIASGLGSSHLHTAKALKEELSEGGFDTATVHGVMGGAWLAPNLDELLANEETKAVLMKTVRMLDTHEEIIGLSGHLLAVSRKKTK